MSVQAIHSNLSIATTKTKIRDTGHSSSNNTRILCYIPFTFISTKCKSCKKIFKKIFKVAIVINQGVAILNMYIWKWQMCSAIGGCRTCSQMNTWNPLETLVSLYSYTKYSRTAKHTHKAQCSRNMIIKVTSKNQGINLIKE